MSYSSVSDLSFKRVGSEWALLLPNEIVLISYLAFDSSESYEGLLDNT